MALLHDRFPGLDLAHLPLGTAPTPVRPLPADLVGREDVWVKDEAAYGDGPWGGNKVRKLEWIIPEAQRRGERTLFTVGGIGTHWGLVCALHARDHGLRTVLGLVDQPVDDHVREQLARLEASGAELHRYRTPRRLRLAAPGILAGCLARDRRLPWYLPAGGSGAVGTLGYVETALELAAQVRAGDLPRPTTIVTAVGSGGTAAGLALGLRLAGLPTVVLGIVVNDAFPLTDVVVAGLARRTARLLRERGAELPADPPLADLTMRTDWLGETYGDPTPASVAAVRAGAAAGLELEPVYTGKALAALRDPDTTDVPGPILWLNTHGPR